MSDDKKKSEPKNPSSDKVQTAPATGVDLGDGIKLKLGETGTVTSGSEDRSTVEVKGKDVPEPKVEVKVSKPQVQSAGKYTIQQGDTPFSVAKDQYGRGSMGNDLRRKNKDVPWKTGNVITL